MYPLSSASANERCKATWFRSTECMGQLRLESVVQVYVRKVLHHWQANQFRLVLIPVEAHLHAVFDLRAVGHPALRPHDRGFGVEFSDDVVVNDLGRGGGAGEVIGRAK